LILSKKCIQISDDSIANVFATGELKEGTDRTIFTLIVKLKISHAHFKMESLPLSTLGNRIINENQKLFLEELIPGLEDSLSRTFSDIVNEILKDSTYDEMFPE
jgi:Haemolymph juvenile hormone binding protein (JHBP)